MSSPSGRALALACVGACAVASACGPSLPPPRGALIPAGIGWFCYDASIVSLTTCSRTVQECERGHRLLPGECALRTRAWCFTATHAHGDAGFAQCASTEGDCARIRRNLMELGDLREPSACAEME